VHAAVILQKTRRFRIIPNSFNCCREIMPHLMDAFKRRKFRWGASGFGGKRLEIASGISHELNEFNEFNPLNSFNSWLILVFVLRSLSVASSMAAEASSMAAKASSMSAEASSVTEASSHVAAK